MHHIAIRRAAHLLCGLVLIIPAVPASAGVQADEPVGRVVPSVAVSADLRSDEPVRADEPVLPPPPAIDGLVGLPRTYTKGRGAYLALIAREAEQAGLPPAVADAVVHVESRFNPLAVGTVGEVGLMQIRPQTAAMLGYSGAVAGLHDPETNVRFGVKYLSRAWQLARGDLCRALMKYRAGWGEERMSPLSAEYCRRAREHLAAIGSPLAGGVAAPAGDASPSFLEAAGRLVRTERPAGEAAPTGARIQLASLGPASALQGLAPVSADAAFRRELGRARLQARTGTRTAADTQRFWAAHEARIRAVKARLRLR